MNIERVIELVNEIGNGEFADIEYTTPVKTVDKNVKLFKHTKALCKIGCSYENLSLTKENRENGQQKSTKANNYEWIIKNVLKHNTKTGNTVLCLDRVPTHTNKHEYLLETETGRKLISNEEAAKFQKPANYGSFVNSMWTVSVANIGLLKKQS